MRGEAVDIFIALGRLGISGYGTEKRKKGKKRIEYKAYKKI